jgi:type I restriction enzyme M protein
MSTKEKSLETWVWDAACSIRGAQDAPKFKDYILPLIFVKRLCDVFDDEIDRIAQEVGSRAKAFQLAEMDPNLVRFYLPIKPDDTNAPVWSVIRKLSSKIGEQLTSILIDIAKHNPRLKGIIDRTDFNASYQGQRDIDDDRLSNLIEAISQKRLGLNDVEPDIIGRSYEYLIRKFAEGSGQSAGEFYTPGEVGMIIAKILNPEPGMECYDPTSGSVGLLIKLELDLDDRMKQDDNPNYAPLKLYGQESQPPTWAMANMNMIIHDMEGKIEIGDTMRYPKFLANGKLRKFDRVVANPMWNQSKQSLSYLSEEFYLNDEYGRFHKAVTGNSADWAWMQHILASLKDNGRAAVVLDTGAASRGSGNASTNKEKEARKWFVDNDLIEGVIYLPENLFYNTSAPGIIIFLDINKPTHKKNKLFLLNAAKEYKKGTPKNYVPDEAIDRISSVFTEWGEIDKYSRVVSKDEIIKNDYNISPSRYIHVGNAEEYRPIGEIVEELSALDEEAAEIDQELKSIFIKLGI